MIPLAITPSIKHKLEIKHNVTELEVRQCFLNRCGIYLVDDREDHRTDPPTLWFVAETDRGRVLKIIFMHVDGNVVLKSAFDASPAVQGIYDRLGK
ncbi:ADP-ribosyl-(dinitrogen reductase) hydrolase [Ralstonia pseudosolanacearum]|uniref:ADP-ribosyl-(dinitrogen reductase) hydrolase n=1 Tax=Ralstonia pseudosolanacearum TaxID=1310165 RepID=UPI0026767B12|nr:ADP-ribosyl-(dinitrogen reductase) hydrolase [Ralstonia pseudosolanacearum]MDO3521828.1 ADP-ribosyl-(dinitrogen reductase) hydrolase [Ralstonia pseudosolanacearum]MDO3547858.1 ADP-ribosyl-(dinitrogen reductase) hydrolase [Ralstonia pseudosolanacearum]MDO3551198.1 ADP-ribosyl-(dinitrogen reductase) hydrolase [Ralstonia pseudosolanacearum]MDO3566207.1 ADP-ribosyl-(dinitrogen reductase) hydrolase [Ralstonia pseudosolanacearum]MDO3580919.1 ADP-ribosyl-(dinitrogen reductase) hydrolase [Ralstonia